MRIAADRQLAVMIIKGINQFPENGDRLGGTIDIWWIVRILRQCQSGYNVVSQYASCNLLFFMSFLCVPRYACDRVLLVFGPESCS